MDAQQQHDLKMSKGIKLTDGSKERLEALLIKKSKSQKKKAISELDPIARAMLQHKGLTREEADLLAEAHGF
jgi:hypothetical protein